MVPPTDMVVFVYFIPIKFLNCLNCNLYKKTSLKMSLFNLFAYQISD